MNVLEPKGVCSDADSRSITEKSAGFSEREQVSRFARDRVLSAMTASVNSLWQPKGAIKAFRGSSVSTQGRSQPSTSQVA
jgi:hypothetical protein